MLLGLGDVFLLSLLGCHAELVGGAGERLIPKMVSTMKSVLEILVGWSPTSPVSLRTEQAQILVLTMLILRPSPASRRAVGRPSGRAVSSPSRKAVRLVSGKTVGRSSGKAV